eukprot:GEMP01004676.1.p1 GENE.GEMP01004676.1~~GEMP01004676.1.p1  ORF type:complete len:1091 (+),score=225.95 GEMP01004676.1:262-3534(+)
MEATFDFLYSLHQLVSTGLDLDDVEEKYIAAHGRFPIHQHLSVDGDTANDLRRALLCLPHLLRVEGNTVRAVEPTLVREKLDAVNMRFVESLAVKHKMHSVANPGELDLPLQAAIVALACGPKPLSDVAETEFVRRRSEFDIFEKDSTEHVRISSQAVEDAKKEVVMTEPKAASTNSAADAAKCSDEILTTSCNKGQATEAAHVKTAERGATDEAKNHRAKRDLLNRSELCKILLKGLAAILRERPLKLDMLQMAFDAKYRSVSKEPLQKLGYASMDDFVRNDAIAKRVINMVDGSCSLVRRTKSPPAQRPPTDMPDAERSSAVEDVNSGRAISPSPSVSSQRPSAPIPSAFVANAALTPSPSLSPRYNPSGESRSPSEDKQLELVHPTERTASNNSENKPVGAKARPTLEESKQKLQQKLRQNREKLLLEKQQAAAAEAVATQTARPSATGGSSMSTNAEGCKTSDQAALRSAHAKLQEKLKLHQQKKESEQAMRDRLKERLTVRGASDLSTPVCATGSAVDKKVTVRGASDLSTPVCATGSAVDKKVTVRGASDLSTPVCATGSAVDKKEQLKDKLKEQLLASRARKAAEGRKSKAKDKGFTVSPLVRDASISLDSLSPRSVQLDELCSGSEEGTSRLDSHPRSHKRSRSRNAQNADDDERRTPKARKTRNDGEQDMFTRSILEVLKWCKRPLTLRELRAHWEDAHPGCYLETHCRYDTDALVEFISTMSDVVYRQDRAGTLRFGCKYERDEGARDDAANRERRHHSEFQSKLRIDADDLHALGGNVSLLARLHIFAIELTNVQLQNQRGRIRSVKTRPTLLWSVETHEKNPWIRYTVSSPSQVFPKISGMWCCGSLGESGNFGPISDHMGAKLSCALKLAKWLARQRNLRTISEFAQEEKNRLTDVHDLEIEDPARKQPRITSDSKASSCQIPAADETATVEVCDDLSFCRLLIALHREKRAVGLAVGKRSLAVCTTKGTFIVRLLILDPAFKPAFSYSLASLVAAKSKPTTADTQTPQIGGQWEGLSELLGDVWADVLDASAASGTSVSGGSLNFRAIKMQSGQSLAAQAQEAWQVLSQSTAISAT